LAASRVSSIFFLRSVICVMTPFSFSHCVRSVLIFSLQLADLALDLAEALLRGWVGLAGECLLLDLKLRHAARQLIDLLRHRRQLDAQARRCFVDEVDCLVGQESVGDVAVRQRGRGDDRGVLNLHAVMHFVAFLETAQNGDRVFDSRLADEHRLEAAGEGCVLLDVLLILVQRRCADRTKLAAGKGGLEHVRGVHRPLRGAGADQRVQLIDEKNNVSFALLDFLDDGFEAVFELAAVFRAGDHRAEVERDDAACS